MFRAVTFFYLLACLFLLFAVPATSVASERGWLEEERIKIKVFPFKDKAYEHIRNGDDEKAAVEFGKVLEIDPLDIGSRLDYAQVLFNLGRYKQAAEQAQKVLQKQPANPNGLMLAVTSLQKLDRNSEALQLLLTKLDNNELSSTDATSAFSSAVNLLLAEKRYKELLNRLQGNTYSFPEVQHAYVSGIALKGSGKHLEARKAFTKALSATGDDALSVPNRLVVLSDLADIHLESDELAQAKKLLLEAYMLDPERTSVSYRLATIAYEEKRYKHALQWIDISIQKKSGTPQLLLKAFILEKSGKGTQALQMLTELEKRNTDPAIKAQILQQIGHTAVALKKYPVAIQSFSQAAELTPSSELLLSLATAQALNEEWEAAVATYELLFSQETAPEKKAQIQLQLGTAYMRFGKKQKAIETFSKALASDALSAKDRTDALQAIGFLQYGNKDYAAAKQTFQSALSKDSTNRSVLLALGRVQLRLDELNAAISNLERLQAHHTGYDISMLLANAYEKDNQQQKAMALYAELLADKSLTYGEKLAVLERMATLESRMGNHNKAGKLYRQAYDLDTAKAVLLLRAGEAFFAAKNNTAALENLKKFTATQLGSDRFEAISMMAFIYAEQDNKPAAIALYKKEMPRTDLTLNQRYTLLVNLGYLLLDTDSVKEGVTYMHQAIALRGDHQKLRLDMGMALYRVKEYRNSVTELLRAKELGTSYEADSALVYCYDKLNKPGIALYYKKEALKSAPKEILEESAEFYDQFAYLYTSEESYAEAAESYRKALSITPTALDYYQLGRVLRLSGEFEVAKEALQAVTAAELPSDDVRAQFFEDTGRVHMELEDYKPAQDNYQKAIDIKPTSERKFLLGQARGAAGDIDGAIESYLGALEIDYSNTYLMALGYAYYKAGKLEEVDPIFEYLQGKDPDYISLVEDLAYINKQLYRNDKSVHWFKKSIENAPFYTDQTKESLRRKIYDFKEEVRNITNRWNIIGFYSYAPENGDFISDSQGVQIGVLDNAAGIEVGYIPKSFGFRNGKIFQFIGRASLTRMDNGVVDFESDSTQGAAGIRYKPFTDANVAVGVERLFKIGKLAEENTLLRLMGSIDDGWAMKAAESHWNYSFLFGEIDKYLDNRSRAVFILHGRQGHTWNVNDALLVTPHLYFTLKKTDPDKDDISYIEGGPALSLRWLEGEDKFVSYKREWELIVRYSYNRQLAGDNETHSGLGVNIRVTF